MRELGDASALGAVDGRTARAAWPAPWPALPRSSACAVFGATRASSAITGVMSRRVEVDAHAAVRRRRRDDAAARRKRRAAEIGDRQAVDLQAVAIDFYSCARVARIDAGDGGAADIGGDRHVVRPLDLGAGEQRLAEAERGVDIEFGRVELGVELGRALAGGEYISEAAGDRLAVELRLQALDRDFVAAEA